MTTEQQWLNDHGKVDEFATDLMHKINQRNQYPTHTQPYAKSDLHVKDLLKKLQAQIDKLQEKLTLSDALTIRETARRQKLIDNLKSRYKKIEYMINNANNSRQILLNQGSYQNYQDTTPSVGWGDVVDVEAGPSSSSNDGDYQSVTKLRDTQQLLLEEQDKGLDTLGNIIVKQKHLALGINSEIHVHNEILEDINEAIVETDERLLRNTRNIRRVDKKSGTCCLWSVIILLLIAIVVAATA